MYMIEITPMDNNAHRNQTYNGILPEGWALVREDISTLESFPFGEVIAEEIDGVMTMTEWVPGEMPEPEPTPLTPAEMREQAYNTERIISWEEKLITVTEASQLWQYYAAEGSDKANTLTTLISEAKTSIREKYPD